MLAVFLYVAGWLLLPDEGEEVSPLEALFGHGQTSLSTGATIALTVVGGVSLILSLNATGAVILVVVLGAVAYLLMRSFGGSLPAGWFGSQGTPPPPPPGTPGTPPGTPGTAYSPAFAPHGPYATAVAPPPPPPPPPKVPKPPKPPKERSALGRLTFSLLLLAVGGVALADVLGATLQPTAYFAAALAVVALGLLVGAVVGRARGLIALGLLVTLGLGVATAAENVDVDPGKTGTTTWRPLTVADVRPSYEHGLGRSVLDLRAVPFGTQQVTTAVDLGAGDLLVLLPARVDATIDAHSGAGQLTILGHHSTGIDNVDRVTDNGTDGPGGGRLDLRIGLGAGNVEVQREAA
jgi:hypothetical protein